MLDEKFMDAIRPGNDMIFKINGFFHFGTIPGWRIVSRTIPDNLLVMARGGTGWFEIDGTRYPVKPGRVFLVSHDVPHRAEQDEADPISIISIRFSLCRAQPLGERFPKCAFVCDPADTHTLTGILLNLHRQIKRYTVANADAQLCSGLLHAFFQVLYGDWSFYRSDYVYDTQMEKVSELIEKDIRASRRPELSRLLRHLDMSRYEFSARFLKYFKTTFRDYVFQKRVAYAEELLQTTGFSVKKIALTVGYSDQYIFSNQFKAVYGCSPKQFRKSGRGGSPAE